MIKAKVAVQYLVALLLLSLAFVSQADGQMRGHEPSPSVALRTGAQGKLIAIDHTEVLIPDVKVFNQEGRPFSFYTDLVKDKLVLLNFFYTSCTYVCKMQGANLSAVQEKLGQRLGKEVFLISVSMDPKADTPQKLRFWARTFKVKPGWMLVTGDNSEIHRMLKAFTGNDTGPKEMHDSLVFIGNDKTGAWVTVNGLSEPETLIDLLDGLLRKSP